MAEDYSHPVKKVASAMVASLSNDDLERLPQELRLTGNFTYSKFLEFMRQFDTSEQQEEAIKKAFKQLDKDGSGYIEWNEIKYILSVLPSSVPVQPLSDEAAGALMESADMDGDGRINFREFSEMIKLEKKPRK